MEEEQRLAPAAAPQVLLLSDGVVAPAAEDAAFDLRAGEFRFVQVAGESSVRNSPNAIAPDNMGIVALGARRDYEDPARVIVFARLLNASTEPREPILTLSVNDRAVATIRARVPAAAIDGLPGEAPVSHAIDLPEGAVITLRHNHRDQLAADDIAAVVMPAPRKPRIALVYPAAEARDGASVGIGPDPYLNELLNAMEPQAVEPMDDRAWAEIDPASIDSAARS